MKHPACETVTPGKIGTLHCNVELGAATVVAIKLGVEAYRRRKTMTWDAKTERMVG